MADAPPYPGMPRWVKVSGIVVIVMALLFVILLVTRGPHRGGSEHSPLRHFGGHAPPVDHGSHQP